MRISRWLHQLAVRFVAVPDASLDFSAHREVSLIDRGLPYLHLAYRSRHWRVYEVSHPTPIVQGAATLSALGPNSVAINARRPGQVLIRVRFSPYWNLAEGAGAASTAAAWKLRSQLAGKTVVGVLSGGNLDLRDLHRILSSETVTGERGV